MKIYQLICSGGEYEDSYEYVVNTYLYEEKAQEECNRRNSELSKENEQAEKCNRCDGCFGCSKRKFDMIKCDDKKVDEENSHDDVYWCENYTDFTADYYEYRRYHIKAYDVIE